MTTSKISFLSADFIMELCTAEASRSVATITVSCTSGGPMAQRFPQLSIRNRPAHHRRPRPARPVTCLRNTTPHLGSIPPIVDASRNG